MPTKKIPVTIQFVTLDIKVVFFEAAMCFVKNHSFNGTTSSYKFDAH